MADDAMRTYKKSFKAFRKGMRDKDEGMIQRNVHNMTSQGYDYDTAQRSIRKSAEERGMLRPKSREEKRKIFERTTGAKRPTIKRKM